jgi:superfamily I DNA and/or RNA helicase
MLSVQYRMHHRIMAWPSIRFYAGALTAAPAVADHLLRDLASVAVTEWTEVPIRFVDTAGCGFEETPGDDDGSKANPREADLVLRIAKHLCGAGVAASAIAVITPYNAQVQLLRRAFAESDLRGKIEIGTVDGMQGREMEATIVSLVRSNESGEVGFLRELRRLNVALTRARRHLTLIGDSATLAHDPDLLGLVEHLQQHADYRSAFEFEATK